MPFGVLNNLAGKKFSQLTVIERAGSNAFTKATWHCRCSCGKKCVAIGSSLLNGTQISCGCYRVSGKGRVTHGARRGSVSTAGYACWMNMKSRCDNPNTVQYKDYGGRGIHYDPRWKIFENFISDMGEPKDGLTIDRIDNDKGYSKDNCRWTDRSTQRRNSRSRLVWVTLNGERMILKDAVEKARIVSLQTAYSRIHSGWKPVDAALTPYTRSDNKGYREHKTISQ